MRSLSSFKFYNPSFHDSTTILAYSPYPFSYDSSHDTCLWERRKQQDVYWDPMDNKECYASRIQDQNWHTWPSPPSSSPLEVWLNTSTNANFGWATTTEKFQKWTSQQKSTKLCSCECGWARSGCVIPVSWAEPRHGSVCLVVFSLGFEFG